MEKENLKFVIVGHVDHGKSTLIGRLFYDTGSLPEEKIEEVKKTCKLLGRPLEFAYIMDHLQEEREQGITIDTAQSFFKTDKRDYVIIDAPGHKEFVKNMMTGASQAEAAILIVSAKEGIQEQTKRHAYILSMLGLSQVIVVMNKMDLIEYKEERFNEVKQELIKFLDSINIKPSYIIPISASKGENVAKKSKNMDWYNGPTILEALDTFKIKESAKEGPLRFSIQDVQKVGEKRILVGRIESGKIKEGDKILFLPSKNESIVTSIEEFLVNDKKEAIAGESTGITIKDDLFIERGEIACVKDNQPNATNKFNANLFWMSKEPLKIGERITLKCATQEIMCNVEKIEKRLDSSSLKVLEENAEKLENNDLGQIIISCEKPIVVENFNKIQELGRFVLEKNLNTVAGGIITTTNIH